MKEKYSMKYENEICVNVNCSYKKLHEDYVKQNFNIRDEYKIIDYYLIEKKFDLLSNSDLEILKNCILIREIIDCKKVLLYKYKEYDENEDIIKQGKVECLIDNIEDAKNFMNAVGYKTLFQIVDKNIVYVNKEMELTVQLVNDNKIYIEVEDKFNFLNKSYDKIEDIKTDLLNCNLDIDKKSFFVKKAQDVLNDQRKLGGIV